MTGQQVVQTRTGAVHTGAHVGAQGCAQGAGAGQTGPPQTAALPMDGSATKRAKAVNVFFIFFSPIRF